MNNIVERLRSATSWNQSKLAIEAADLIESLQARVKELEAELLSALAQAEHNGDELAAAARRIAELEAGLEANLQQRVRMQHTINQYESGDKASKYYACPDCAALRKRIEAAPVVAWQDETGFISVCSGGGYFRELIRKEDLT